LHSKYVISFLRYEEAREEERLRSQREDFSDMVAEVCGASYVVVFVLKNGLVSFCSITYLDDLCNRMRKRGKGRCRRRKGNQRRRISSFRLFFWDALFLLFLFSQESVLVCTSCVT